MEKANARNKLHAFSQNQADQFSSNPNDGNFDSDVKMTK